MLDRAYQYDPDWKRIYPPPLISPLRLGWRGSGNLVNELGSPIAEEVIR